MQKIKRQYPDIKYMWIPRHYEAKDISDFVKKYGKQDTIKLIKEGIRKL
jgi:3-deoxy-D-manno-octulosonic-acid transferase